MHARPLGWAPPEPGEVGAKSRRPGRSWGERPQARIRSALWCSSRAWLLGSLSRFLSLSRILLPLSLRARLPPPGSASPQLPLGRTCSRRRSRMQWGALRARASRPPQQPPGLAGSRILRPPRAPLAVPRCPHRPHGGRLSQPEALQQGSDGRWRDGEAGSAHRQEEGAGEDRSLQCSQPLHAPGRGLKAREDAEAPCRAAPSAAPESRWLTTGAPLQDAPRNGSPGWPPTRSLTGHLHPHPIHLPSACCWELCDQKLLGGGDGGREKKRRKAEGGRWLSLRRAGRRRGGGKNACSRGPGSPREVR